MLTTTKRLNKTKKSPDPFGVLRAHHSGVNCVVFLLRESWLLSGCAGGELKLWDLNRRRVVWSVPAHSESGILQIRLIQQQEQEEKQIFLTLGRDGLLRVWRLDLTQLPVLEKSVMTGSYTFTRFATFRSGGGQDNTMNSHVLSPTEDASVAAVFDISSKDPEIIRLKSPDEKKTGMCMSLALFSIQNNDSSTVYVAAVGYESGSLSFYNIRDGGKMLMECIIFKEPLLSFDVNKSGTRAYCGSAGADIKSVELDFNNLVMKPKTIFTVNHPGINCVRIRDDQRIFATAGWDHRIRIFHCEKEKPIAILRYHSESVFDLDFCHYTNNIAAGSKDCKISMWSI